MFCRQVFGNISGRFRVLGGISRDFAEIPEFHGSATARNIRSPALFFFRDNFAGEVFLLKSAVKDGADL